MILRITLMRIRIASPSIMNKTMMKAGRLNMCASG